MPDHLTAFRDRGIVLVPLSWKPESAMPGSAMCALVFLPAPRLSFHAAPPVTFASAGIGTRKAGFVDTPGGTAPRRGVPKWGFSQGPRALGNHLGSRTRLGACGASAVRHAATTHRIEHNPRRGIRPNRGGSGLSGGTQQKTTMARHSLQNNPLTPTIAHASCRPPTASGALPWLVSVSATDRTS
jgi:hypothetical protein